MSNQASVLRVPLEIFRHIAHFADLEGLIFLISLSRQTRNVVTPLAYQHICFPHPHQIPTMLRFMRSLRHEQSLAAHVRHVTVNFYDRWSNDDIVHDIQQMSTDAGSCGLSTRIQVAIMEGSAAGLLSLLLCSLPELRSLKITNISTTDDSFFDEIPHMPSYHWLQSLRSIFLSHSTLSSRRAIIPCLLLKNLTSIRCQDMVKLRIYPDANDTLVEVATRSLRLEHIHVENCELEDMVLGTMIRSSQGLKSLTLRRNSSTFFDAFTLSDLEHTLREYCQDTLESLELDFKDDLPRTHSFVTLNDFSRLAHVSAPLAILLQSGHDLRSVLPPSLTSLSISIDPELANGGWWCSEVLRLLERNWETGRSLQKLRIESGRKLAEEEIIQKACDAAQVIVTFIVVSTPPPPPPSFFDFETDESSTQSSISRPV